MRIERDIAGIADISDSRAAYPHRLRQQGNLRQADLQGAGIHHHPAIRHGIDQGDWFAHALRDPKRPGKNRRPVGSDHGAVVITAGECQVERGLIAESADPGS